MQMERNYLVCDTFSGGVVHDANDSRSAKAEKGSDQGDLFGLSERSRQLRILIDSESLTDPVNAIGDIVVGVQCLQGPQMEAQVVVGLQRSDQPADHLGAVGAVGAVTAVQDAVGFRFPQADIGR